MNAFLAVSPHLPMNNHNNNNPITSSFPPAPDLSSLNLTDLDHEGLPKLPDGLGWHSTNPAGEFFADPFWYSAFGNDPFVRQNVFAMEPGGEEQVAALLRILHDFPRYGPKMYEEAARQGQPGVIRALLALGTSLERDEVWKSRGGEGFGDEGAAGGSDGSDDGGNHDGGEGDPRNQSPMVSIEPALGVAAYHGHLECVQVLVEEAGVEVDQLDEDGYSALHHAAINGRDETVKWLLTKGASTSLVCSDDDDADVLHLSLKSGSMSVVEAVLSHLSPGGSARPFSMTLKHMAYAAEGGNADILNLVLDHCDELSAPTGNIADLTEEQRGRILQSIGLAVYARSLASELLLLPYVTTHDAQTGAFVYFDTPQYYRTDIFIGLEHPPPPSSPSHQTSTSSPASTSAVVATDDDDDDDDDIAFFELNWNTIICPPTLQGHEILTGGPHPRTKKDCLYLRLISASIFGSPNLVRHLVEKYHLDVNFVSERYGTTPLGRAATRPPKSIMPSTPPPPPITTETTTAAAAAAAARPDQPQDLRDESLTGRLAVAKYLLARPEIDLHLSIGEYANGPTALALAVRHCANEEDFEQKRIVALLLEHGGPVDEVDADVKRSVKQAGDEPDKKTSNEATDEDGLEIVVVVYSGLETPRQAAAAAVSRARKSASVRLMLGTTFDASGLENEPGIQAVRLKFGTKKAVLGILDRLQIRRSDAELVAKDPRKRPRMVVESAVQSKTK